MNFNSYGCNIICELFFGIKPKGIPSKVKLLKEHFEIQYEFENKNEIRSWEVVDILPDFVSQEQNLILKYGIQHPFEFWNLKI